MDRALNILRANKRAAVAAIPIGAVVGAVASSGIYSVLFMRPEIWSANILGILALGSLVGALHGAISLFGALVFLSLRKPVPTGTGVSRRAATGSAAFVFAAWAIFAVVAASSTLLPVAGAMWMPLIGLVMACASAAIAFGTVWFNRGASSGHLGR